MSLFSLFQLLSLLLLPCFIQASPPDSQPPAPSTQPPYPPPSKPPTQPPVQPPPPPPTKPPTYNKPPTKPLRPEYVQGMVYCKNCHYLAFDTLYHSKPLAGARVVLKCEKSGRFAKQIATTNEHGYFFMTASKLIGVFGYKNCRMMLASAPRATRCREHTNINNGTIGAVLRPMDPLIAPSSYDLYTVGPFAFQPTAKFCKKHSVPIPN